MKPAYIRTGEELAAVVKTPESLVLEFKGTIDKWNIPKTVKNWDELRAEGQQETCRDIAQFANTNGGCLLIGVQECVDPVTQLKVGDRICGVTDPERMKEWIEEAVRNYLVPATFSHDITEIHDINGIVLAVNIPPSIHAVALWNRKQHTIELVRRTSHGKAWMNPDELERHIMNSSRAAKIAFDTALTEARDRVVRLAGGYWQRVGNPPITTLQPWYPDSPVTIGQVGDQWFELEFKVGPATLSLNLPFGLIEQAWVGTDGRVHLFLSVRVVHHYAGREVAVERYD